jgi:hypothetical protein
MLIDCGQCAFREVACGDCLITSLAGKESASVPAVRQKNINRNKRNKEVSNGRAAHSAAPAAAARHRVVLGPGAGSPSAADPDQHALGAVELRALGALAAAGLIPPLRFRPAEMPARVILALPGLARAVIGETRATLAEAVETTYCFH